MANDPLARVRQAVAKLSRETATGGFMRVSIVDDTATGSAGLDRIFDAFSATMDDMPRILEAVVPDIRAAHRAVFATEGAAGRGRWARLAPATLRERQRLGFGPGPIHVRTGALREHVLSAPAKITRRGDTTELRIRPADNVGGVPKYRALALGTSTIPARPMVALGPNAARSVTSGIQRAMRARAAAHGL